MTITNNNEMRNEKRASVCLLLASTLTSDVSLLAGDELSPSSSLQNDTTVTIRMEYPTDLMHRKIPQNKPGLLNGKI